MLLVSGLALVLERELLAWRRLEASRSRSGLLPRLRCLDVLWLLWRCCRSSHFLSRPPLLLLLLLSLLLLLLLSLWRPFTLSRDEPRSPLSRVRLRLRLSLFFSPCPEDVRPPARSPSPSRVDGYAASCPMPRPSALAPGVDEGP